jgi:hypothetical protein
VLVDVVLIYLRMVSKLSRGHPAQFLLISLKSLCSMGFHLAYIPHIAETISLNL